jgi:hypothetical protein
MYINVPQRYIPKNLSKKEKEFVKRELIKSRKRYKEGKYYTRKNIKSYKYHKSKHIKNAEKIYKLKNLAINDELVKKTGCNLCTLKKIFKKGQGAYFSNGSRINQKVHTWAYARLASSITGGKASAVDFKLLEKGCKSNSKALKLAKKVYLKYKKGTRRVPKVKLM